MKKYLNILIILSLFLSCSKNMTSLDSIIYNAKIRRLINEFANQVIQNSNNKNIYITSSIGKDSNIMEIGIYNERPSLYNNKNAKFLNTNLESKRIGLFKYKGINFYVTDDLKNIFKLNYEDIDKVKNKFDLKDSPIPIDNYCMFININKKDSCIIYSSNLPGATLKWKKLY